MKKKRELIKTSEIKNDIDCLANNIFNYYIEALKKNNFRLFAKDVDFELKEVDVYELNAFKSWFKVYLKTDAQFRKTKHIKSECLSIYLPDFYDNYYTVNFVVYTDRRNIPGYLDDVYNIFISAIENKIRKKEMVIK